MISLFLRIPAHGEDVSIIAAAHIETIATEGSVWLGAIGRGLSGQNREKLRKQGEYLYLVQWLGRQCQAYRGKIVDVADRLPLDERKLAPAYYGIQNVFAQAKVWVKLTSLEQIKAEEVATLSVLSTGTRIPRLIHSMTSLAIVVRDAERRAVAIG
jgi:hypothetical protein